LALVADDERMAKVFDMALDDAANKPVVDIKASGRAVGAKTRAKGVTERWLILLALIAGAMGVCLPE
jgi:hypothetical protein